MNKTYFQDIHYSRIKPNIILKSILGLIELFYKIAINSKNYLYEINILKETKVNAYVICVGNLTTGGVGKTPIVQILADILSKNNNVAIISRGYGSKLNPKKVNVIKSRGKIRYKDGTYCGDEIYQLAQSSAKNVTLVTCANRLKAALGVIRKYKTQVIILDDGFSNRKLKKDMNIIVIDSKMRFGNGHLLPLGPLREPKSEIKRANEIILVDKGDENLEDAINWAKANFLIPLRLCTMIPNKVYNIQTHAKVVSFSSAIAFCAIGQSEQFFNFARKIYDIKDEIRFDDHHRYSQKDIQNLLTKAKEHNVFTFITTKKDETKLKELIKDIKGYCFCVLELKSTIQNKNL